MTELSASTGALVKVISGSSYGFDNPDAVASDGTHVWVANAKRQQLGDGAVGLDRRAGQGHLRLELRVQRSRARSSSDGTHVWVANASGNTVTELSASTGALVKVISGSSYGFNDPMRSSSDGTHVWVANPAATR